MLWGQSVINNRKTVSTIGGRTFDKQHRDKKIRERNVPFLFLFQWKKRVKQENIVCSVLRVFSVSQVGAGATQEPGEEAGAVSGDQWRWHQMMIYPPTLSLVICHRPGPGPHRNISTSLTNYFNYTLFVPEVRCSAPKLLVPLKDHHIIFKRTWHHPHPPVPMLLHQNWSRR